ncbi:MAG: hypothetical protein WCW93_02725 [Candidatus Paceibacterota bacterium]
MIIINYIKDFIYGATKYPCALFKPKVFVGCFGTERHGYYQKIFFSSLIKVGFKRTFWQLVFPGQTAGLIKTIPVTFTGINEYHIRFYDDGVIECELEVDRWSGGHWTGPRCHGEDSKKLLQKILETELRDISPEEQSELHKLFGVKNFALECVRTQKKQKTSPQPSPWHKSNSFLE